MSPGEFRRLSDEAKTRAFAVSGIAKGDELATVMAAMQKAIDQGTTLADFKKDCAAVFEKRGWTGRRAWRIDNIFRTNIQTAYSVGRYKQMQEVKARRPYWQYSAVNDSRTRPSHAAMHGKVYPADHAFWNTWYPPNGFRCRCGVVTLSERDIRAENLTVETDEPTGKLIEPVDPVTGNKMPARLLMPDSGFAHNPGKSAWGGVVDASEKPGQWAAVPKIETASDYRPRHWRKDVLPTFPRGMKPVYCHMDNPMISIAPSTSSVTEKSVSCVTYWVSPSFCHCAPFLWIRRRELRPSGNLPKRGMVCPFRYLKRC
jgi:SPP1 gp7 family putative phage head morphogenesis protein